MLPGVSIAVKNAARGSPVGGNLSRSEFSNLVAADADEPDLRAALDLAQQVGVSPPVAGVPCRRATEASLATDIACPARPRPVSLQTSRVPRGRGVSRYRHGVSRAAEACLAGPA